MKTARHKATAPQLLTAYVDSNSFHVFPAFTFLRKFVLTMKRLKIRFLPLFLLVTFSLLTNAVAFGQVPAGTFPNKTDEKGRKQGEWKKLDENGTCVYIGQFKDDKPYGTFTYFDTDGRKMTEMNFGPNGGTVAYAKMYHINGNIQAEGKYINQQKDSLWRFYTYEVNGQLLSEENYVKGKKHGKATVYYPGTKQAASITNFVNGLEEGAYVEYFSDGAKKEEATYIAGNLEGKAVWYFPDGRINIIGYYQHAVKHGTWIYYEADGKERGREVWELGKLKSQEQLIKPADIKTDKQDYPGMNGQDPNGGN
jgi:antitoxin component YwqK of YwqJK toxin-antitoxin module